MFTYRNCKRKELRTIYDGFEAYSIIVVHTSVQCVAPEHNRLGPRPINSMARISRLRRENVSSILTWDTPE